MNFPVFFILVHIVIQGNLLRSPFLQHPLILFLGATALAAPLGPEEVAAELPDCIQNSFYCHKLKITSGQHNKAYTDYLIQPSIRPTSSWGLPNSQFHPTYYRHTMGWYILDPWTGASFGVHIFMQAVHNTNRIIFTFFTHISSLLVFLHSGRNT